MGLAAHVDPSVAFMLDTDIMVKRNQTVVRPSRASSSAAVGGGYKALQMQVLARRARKRRVLSERCVSGSSLVAEELEELLVSDVVENQEQQESVEERRAAERLYMQGLPTLEQLAMLPRVVVAERRASVAVARNSVTPACAVNWKAERRWARSRSMCGRAVPRANRNAEPDRTTALDAMNLGVVDGV